MMIASLEAMRTSVTLALLDLSPSSKARDILEHIRTVLQEFQTFIEYVVPPEKRIPQVPSEDVLRALYKMRRHVSDNLLILSKAYDIKLEHAFISNFTMSNIDVI